MTWRISGTPLVSGDTFTHLTDSDASNGGAGEDGWGGDEEEEDGQDAVAQPQVEQEQAARLPSLFFLEEDGQWFWTIMVRMLKFPDGGRPVL